MTDEAQLPAKVPDIRSVARLAGVSISTVSRYINSKVVSADAEQKIKAAIAELGYRPNRIAQSLKLRRTNTIGIVIPDITNNFFPDVVKGAEDAAIAANFHVVLANTGEDPVSEWDRLLTLQTLRCDGCLLILAPDGPGEPERRKRLVELSLPLVYVDRAPLFPADAVITDNLRITMDAVKYLTGLGHKRIAILESTLEVTAHRDRGEGFRRALKEAGLSLAPECVAQVRPTVAEGHAGTTRLLALADRPTAIFATANRLTVGALAAIHDRGLRCPADVSILGYDDYEWEEAFRPRLTTVVQPAYQMGKRGAELLIARLLNQKSGPPEQVVVESRLQLRDSCAAPPKR